jgi:hypothetical protein
MSVAGTVVVIGFGMVALHVTEAQAADVAMSFGDQLLQVGESNLAGTVEGDVYHVSFNGQNVDTANAATRRPMREVLDYFAEQCKSHAEGIKTSFQHLDHTLHTLQPATEGGAGVLVFQKEVHDRGFVFCFAPDQTFSSQRGLLSRFAEAGRSGDFGRIGNMRYVAVKQLPTEARVVTAWTEGKMDITAMFPEHEDCPGRDFGSVPRPDGARRVLSATVEGAPAGVNGYVVAGKSTDVLDQVNRKLTDVGWHEIVTPDKVPHAGRYYTLGSKLDLVVTATDETHDMTSLSYIVSKGIGTTSH